MINLFERLADYRGFYTEINFDSSSPVLYCVQHKNNGVCVELTGSTDGIILHETSPADEENYVNSMITMLATNKSSADEELVLCVDASDLPTGIPIDIASLGGSRSLVWLPRKFAETETRVRQVIPYAVVCRPPSMDILWYKRGSESESRLHTFHSIGWGGHINECDVIFDNDGQLDLNRTMLACVERELKEEISTKIDILGITPMYIYIDADSEVGQVHLCVAQLVMVDCPDTRKSSSAQWAPLHQPPVHPDKLEKWSQILYTVMLEQLAAYQSQNQITKEQEDADRTE